MTRALVVDDDEDFARLVERRLLVLGWEVETVNTPIGLSARLLVEPTINVLIIDCMMPALSGPMVLALLARHQRLRRMPMVLTSAAPQPAFDRSGLERMCFVQKTGRISAIVEAAVGIMAPSATTAGAVGKDREVYSV